MYTVLSTLFCIAGWITALIVNVVWYKHCDKMNNEWCKRCLSINETWADHCMELIGDETDRKTEPMADDLIRKSDVLETYADLYDIFDDNKAIQDELHKVFDKINDIPAVKPSNSEKPNNSTISKMEQVDKDINVRSKDEPQTCDTCRFELYCPEMCKGCCEWDSHYEPKDEQSGKE